MFARWRNHFSQLYGRMNMELMTLGRQKYIKQSQQNNSSEICKLINSIWNKEELHEGWRGVDHCTYL